MSIGATTRLAGVMGWPVSHSLSPALHNRWLKRYGIDGAYVPLPVSPEHFPQALRLLAQMGFRGVNVTVPHKEAALHAVDRIDDQARRIGAVNTVVMGEDGSLIGRNTDGEGFLAALRARVPGAVPEGVCVLIGAGGAARAIAVALLDSGVEALLIVNRGAERATALAMALRASFPEARIQTVNWVHRAETLAEASLVVNTTSLGMVGMPPLDLSLDALGKSAIVYDIVYNPLKTPLLARAEAEGHRIVGGLGMLLHQAVPGFEAWFGVRPEVDEALEAFLAARIAPPPCP